MKATVMVIYLMFVQSLSYATAASASQTDWSGGDEILGPVIDWGDEFYISMDIEYYGNQSNIVLLPLEHHVAITSGSNSVYSADVNGDGYMDVLVASMGGIGCDISWYENLDGTGTSWTEHIVDGDFHWGWSVYSADVNEDGYMDILGAAMLCDSIIWWENNNGTGTSWTEHVIDGDFGGACSIYSADVNGDGYMDVLGAGCWANDITWWENEDGLGTSWTEHTVDGNFLTAVSVYTADINGDGFMDVLGAAVDYNKITWWENEDGTGTSWIKHVVDDYFEAAWSVYSADVNGDGYMDVLGAASRADDITWWENNDGTGTSWAEHVIDGDFEGARSVYSADIDGDGDMDVLGGAGEARDITWWENEDGLGTSWIEHTVDGYFTAYSVYSADVNGDGAMDVLGASNYDNDTIWWDLTAFQSDGLLVSSVLDVQESPDWQTIDWTCTEPSGTSVAFQVRASDNSSSMGTWSDTLTSPCNLAGILTEGDCYLQYRAILTTADSLFTPVLDDVMVTWNPLGIESNPTISEFSLYGTTPNPARVTISINFAVPKLSMVGFYIYDLYGRLVTTHAQEEYPSGVHQVQFDVLAPGIYFCRMISEEFTATQRFVVIE